jgi:hypothetical protein
MKSYYNDAKIEPFVLPFDERFSEAKAKAKTNNVLVPPSVPPFVPPIVPPFVPPFVSQCVSPCLCSILTMMLVIIFWVNFGKINKKYFYIIKSTYRHKFNIKGFRKTGFRTRIVKVLYTHKKFLRTVLLILCLEDFYLNLRHTPLAQAQLNNWNIAHTCKQLAKIKLDITHIPYNELDQHFKKMY